MRKSKQLITDFEKRMGLNKKSEKLWFWITFTLLVMYVEAVVFMQNYLFGNSPAFLTIFCAIIIIPICFIGVSLFNKLSIDPYSNIKKRSENRNKDILFSVIIFLLTFLIFFMWQRAFWPGCFSADSVNQYEQVLSGEYSNWHPVLHTWIFFTFPYIIFHSTAGIVTFQIFVFSTSVSYLFHVLYKNGCNKKYIIISWIYIIANPNTAKIMVCPWKDNAMTAFALIVFTQLIQIYITNGIWIKKWYNLLSFTLFSFLTICMRHNAVLLIAPILVFLFIFMKKIRKHIFAATVSVAIAFVLLNGPVFEIAKVEEPGYRTVETMGLPMTVLSYVYMNDRDSMSDECEEFMDSLASQKEWNEYFSGDFNSIKFKSPKNLKDNIESAGAGRILKYTVETFINSPGNTIRAIGNLTNMVWCFESNNILWNTDLVFFTNNLEIQNSNQNIRLASELSAYYDNCNKYFTKYIFDYIGVIILIMMFAAVGKIGHSNLSKVFIVLSPLAYNFGTMLLLSGGDFRFFHFNFVIIIPLLYLFFVKKEADDNGKNIEISEKQAV